MPTNNSNLKNRSILVGENKDGIKTGAVGSGFLNSSYSGADIRIMVNLRVNPLAIELETGRIDNQLQDAERDLERAKTILSKANIRLEEGRVGYESIEGAASNLLAAEERIEILNKKRNDLQDISLRNNESTLTKTIATCQTLSWSIFREKTPVRFLGSVYPRAYVRGPRTIAGSMIFTMFDKHAFQDILNWGLSPYSTGHVESDHDYYLDTTMLIDQLPPLDITLMFANEYGSTSYMNLYGVEFQSEGGTFSIEDLFSESVVQYVARDIDPIRDTLQRTTDQNTNALSDRYKPKTASQLRRESFVDQDLAVVKRRNPYI